jgi:hypothetical protein
MIDNNDSPFHKANEYSPARDLTNLADEYFKEFRRQSSKPALSNLEHKRMVEVTDSELALLYITVKTILKILKGLKDQKEEVIQKLEALNNKLEKELEKAKIV